MKKAVVWSVAVILAVLVVATVGGSFYMLDYSLSPDQQRTDTALCFRQQFEHYPETRPWIDSLKRCDALRDTFVTMPTGELHHALYIKTGGNKTALVLHGWRDCGIDFLFLARLYERELGYNVVIPDLHAHGLSDGDMIQMGWLDREDALHWLTLFQTDTMVIHGVSMGAATAMMMSAMEFPKGIKDIRFVEDCGYTSVWDEFAGELKNQFGLPEFPLMYSTSLLCKLRYGWSFGEASAIREVGKSPYPMLFIHGADDTFVPTEMVHRLYDAKPAIKREQSDVYIDFAEREQARPKVKASRKELWITEGAEHAQSYIKHKEEYVNHIKEFLINDEI